MKLVFEKSVKLRTSDFDTFDNITPYAVLDLFQDIAGEHATKIGLGYHEMVEKKLIWVLVRTKFEIIKSPKMYEEVKLVTWPEVKGRVDMDRDYLILGENDEVLVKGKSKWVVVDLNTRHIVRTKEVIYPEGEYVEEKTFEDLPKVEDFGISDLPSYTAKTAFSDLDHNGHVNNASYANFIVDALNLSKNEEIKVFEINYENETRQNEEIIIYYSRCDRTILIKGTQKERLIFKAKLELK